MKSTHCLAPHILAARDRMTYNWNRSCRVHFFPSWHYVIIIIYLSWSWATCWPVALCCTNKFRSTFVSNEREVSSCMSGSDKTFRCV